MRDLWQAQWDSTCGGSRCARRLSCSVRTPGAAAWQNLFEVEVLFQQLIQVFSEQRMVNEERWYSCVLLRAAER
jgi:hypothetical protein